MLEAARQVTGRRAAYRKTVVLPATRITPPTGSTTRLPTGVAKTIRAAPAAPRTPRPPGASSTNIFLRGSRTAAADYPKTSNSDRGTDAASETVTLYARSILVARAVSVYRGSVLVRGRPLLESGDPYFEADEVLGKFASCAHLHQLLYARCIISSLSLRYLLRTFSGYGVEIIHSNFLF